MIILAINLFPGSVQTLLSIFATILVLLILADKSNIIYRRLAHYTESALVSLSTIKGDVENILKGIRENVKLKKLRSKRKDIKGTDRLRLDRLSSKVNNLQTTFSEATYISFERNIKGVQEADEIIHAPFYFIFYIVFLFIEEIAVEYWTGFKLFSITTITTFTLLSVIFWSYKWVHFTKRELPSELSLSEEYPFKKTNWKRIIYLCLGFIVCSLLLAVVVKFLIQSFEIPAIFSHLMWVLIPVLIFCLIGTEKLKYAEANYRHSSYASLIAHFICIGVCSIGYAAVYHLMSGTSEALSISTEAENQYLILLILSVIVLFGIILPFWLPYRRWTQINKEVKTSAETLLQQMKAKQATLESDITTFHASL